VGTNGGIGAANLRARLEASLRRLRTECVDLLYVHVDDEVTPPEETLTTLDELRREGKLRFVAASNYSVSRLRSSLHAAGEMGVPGFVALQVEYSLVERSYEDELLALCAAEGLACIPYFPLAAGFLTGKYRPGSVADTRRSAARLDGSRYLDERGLQVLAALDEVAAECSSPPAAVALAWLLSRPTVATVTTSARSPEQLADLLPAAVLELEPSQVDRLTHASRLGR
jgi:aryl-alcohol dehydrogenase-like predicted oxidoreductase